MKTGSNSALTARAEVKTEQRRIDALEAQLRHLTLPTQRGYRRTVQKCLDSLRKADPLTDADHAILESLKYPSERTYGRNDKPLKPWLYAAADKWDSRKADWNEWFVTGPTDRRGYIKGPFGHAQVKRIAASGMLVPVCCDENGEPVAYELSPSIPGEK